MKCIYITCSKCKKTFEIEKNLIPDFGCEVKCGSCSNVWFFNPRKLNIKKIDEISLKYPGEIPKDVENLILDAERSE